MNHDELRELEKRRRRALWEIAGLLPGDPKAADALMTLKELDEQERKGSSSMDKPFSLTEVHDCVFAQRHCSGIYIVLEITIPQPWRERFFQASMGSTRLPAGPYACDWEKFVSEWDAEMAHLNKHRALAAEAESLSGAAEQF